VIWASGVSVLSDILNLVIQTVQALFLFDNGWRCGELSVDRDVYPLQASLGSAGGIVGLRVLHG